MADVVIDTDVASLLLKGREPDWVGAALLGATVWLTFVTIGELAKWAEVRSWGPPARRRLDTWVADRPVIPYDGEVALVWGHLAGAAQLRGRPRPQNDTWVAACCVRHGVPLLTLNTKDFVDFVAHDRLVLLQPPAGGPGS